jgi:hypothetical protein
VELHDLCSTEKETKSEYMNPVRQVAGEKGQGISITGFRKPKRKREFGAYGCKQDEDSNATHGEKYYCNEHCILSWSSRDDGYELPRPSFLHHRIIKTVCYGTKIRAALIK